MQQYRNTDYIRLSAALHAREARLLTHAMLARMLDAPTPEESWKTLSDCGYDALERCTMETVERALAQQRAALYRELRTMAPDTRAVEMFQLRYDYHNAKLALKGKCSGAEVSALAADCGRFDAGALLRGDASALPLPVRRAMVQAEREAEGGDLRAAELTLDRACFKELAELAAGTGSEFAVGYAALATDAANLRTLVRIRRMGGGDELLRAALLHGGGIPVQALLSTRGGGLEELTRTGPLRAAGELAVPLLDGSGSLTDFERACDDALISYLQRARRTPFGIEVVMGYLGAKEAEFAAVRTILSGKLARLDAEKIRARLRLSYL